MKVTIFEKLIGALFWGIIIGLLAKRKNRNLHYHPESQWQNF
jgi:hypothetical protein